MSVSEDRLREVLKKLEESAQKIIATRGYTNEVKRVRLLEELIKEQLKSENISRSTRPIR